MNRKKSTVVYITSSFPFGKSEVWAINEINSLMQLGNEVIIVPRNGDLPLVNSDAKKFLESSLRFPIFNLAIAMAFVRITILRPALFGQLILENFKHANTLVDFVKGLVVIPKSLFLAGLLRGKGVTHIHSLQTTTTAFIAFILSCYLKVSWSYTLHTSETLSKSFKRSLLFYSRSASICRAISRGTARDLSIFLKFPLSEKVKMVHFGVDIPKLRETQFVSRNWFTVVTPAELSPRKGHIFSLLAAKCLVDSGIRNFTWFFYGSGPLLRDLLFKVRELNLDDYCFFKGSIDHETLLGKYRNNEVDVVVISSVSTAVPEGIPVSLMEAMSFEVPVIATDCGGTRELVDGRAGILVDQGEPLSIATALRRIFSDDEYRKVQGREGRAKVVREFNTLENAKELGGLFSRS